MAKLDFWFDFASTYSYLTAMRIEAVAGKSGIEVRWRPFLLGPIFATQGWDNSPFNIYPVKGRYMQRDMERLTAQYELDLKWPEVFPQFALIAARVGVAAKEEPWLAEFCRAVFVQEYGQGGDITSRAAIARALGAAGAEPDFWLERAGDSDVKQTLKDRVEEAQSLAIFGAPTFVCQDGELFWGDDRLEQALAWAAKNQAGGTSPS